MTQPGWFPDPSGRPQQQRWFDGQRWTEHTRSTAAAAGRAPQPRPRRRLVGVWVVLLCVVLVLGASTAVGLFLLRPRAQKPVAHVPLNCANGSPLNGLQADQYTAFGVTLDAPGDYTLPLGQEQFNWLRDASHWAKGPADYPSGFALGGVRRSDGFTWDNALAGYRTCLETVGPSKTSKLTADPAKDTTIDGMRARTQVFHDPDPDQPYWMKLYVLDSGTDPGVLVTVYVFAPDNPDDIGAVERMADEVHRA